MVAQDEPEFPALTGHHPFSSHHENADSDLPLNFHLARTRVSALVVTPSGAG